MKRFAIALILLVPVVLVLAATETPAADSGHEFVGSKNCKKCHIKEYKSWETTAMAQTFETLKPGVKADEKTAAGLDPTVDFTTNAECLACHATGYGQSGGFTTIEETPELAGVGCEMCHGAGGTYTQDELMSLKNKEYALAEVVAAGMVEKVSADQCTVCHKAGEPFPGADYTFNFEEKNAIPAPEGTHERFDLKYEH